MAEPAPATENNEPRRIEMLRAAAELICERGFGDTRIADVAKRAGVSSALLSLLIKWTCVPQSNDDIPGAWGLWFDLWAQAFRHDEVKAGRVELDARWRNMIINAIKSGDVDVDVDARTFALEFSALLDGLSIQVALEDPEVDSEVAYNIAMRFAERELNLPPAKKVAAKKQ